MGGAKAAAAPFAGTSGPGELIMLLVGVELQEVDPILIIGFNDILSGWNSTIGAILAGERQRIHDLDIFDFIRSKHFSN